MSFLTPEKLAGIVAKAAGLPPAAATVELLDRPITDVGIDSLALLEIVALVQREHGVRIDDGQLSGIARGGDFLPIVNDRPVAA